MKPKPIASNSSGPVCYENWLAASGGAPKVEGGEVPLFTDVHITNECDIGPYQLLNTIASGIDPGFTPAVMLRFWWHLAADGTAVTDAEKTNAESYHGGWLADEIAALVSLSMGVRMKAGGECRHFLGFAEKDPYGRPFLARQDQDPQPPKSGRWRVLPRSIESHDIKSGCMRLKTLLSLKPAAANTLIRAARMFQEGLWIADADPSASWLLLVSAVETVASFWRNDAEDPFDRLRASRPDIASLLGEKGDEEWVRSVASKLAPYMGATKTFTEFLIKFLPEPPVARESVAHHPWDEKDLRKSFKKIYDWRSKALHGGIPFPMPMCEAPAHLGDHIAETPLGLATMSRGGVWLIQDTPMLLHLFVHIVRGAILKWWDTTAAGQAG